MNVRHQGVLHPFSIKNIFYDKMDLKVFYFDVAIPITPENIRKYQGYFYRKVICFWGL